MSHSEAFKNKKQNVFGPETTHKDGTGSTTPTKHLTLPSPIITRRTRTSSTSARALENPLEKGKVRVFCREKGHGFITSDRTGEDIFVHVSDIIGEYVPLPGDEVTYRLCPIPPKYEKNQAVNVDIVNLTPEVHLKWNSISEVPNLRI